MVDPEAEVIKRANPNMVEVQAAAPGASWPWATGRPPCSPNVLLKTMEFTVFGYHAHTADTITGAVLKGVISDERRHLGFGENDLGAPDSDCLLRARLGETKKELDGLVLAAFDGAFDDLGLAPKDRPNLGREYLEAVERLGLVT